MSRKHDKTYGSFFLFNRHRRYSFECHLHRLYETFFIEFQLINSYLTLAASSLIQWTTMINDVIFILSRNLNN